MLSDVKCKTEALIFYSPAVQRAVILAPSTAEAGLMRHNGDKCSDRPQGLCYCNEGSETNEN